MNKHLNISSIKSKETGKIKYEVKNTIQELDFPIFCFRYLNKNYNIDKCPTKDKQELITRLAKLAELGFKEIDKSGRHQFGHEKIPRKSLKINLPDFITEDVDFVYAYRYNVKKNPFIAYRRPISPLLHILAIDYNFTLYKH